MSLSPGSLATIWSRAHHPDAGAFLAARVDVARQLDRHLGVGRVQAAAVLVVQAGLAAHEHFPQRPFAAFGHRPHAQLPAGASGAGLMRLLRRCVRAAPPRAPRHRRPRPSRAAASRSRLHGPSPPTTRQNSSQSIGAEVVVLALLVPLQVRVGQRHAEHLGLLDAGIDELLAQLVVADALDAPAHRLRAVRRLARRAGRTSSATATTSGSTASCTIARCASVPFCHHRQQRRRSPGAGGSSPRGRCGSSRAHTARTSSGRAAPGS